MRHVYQPLTNLRRHPSRVNQIFWSLCMLSMRNQHRPLSVSSAAKTFFVSKLQPWSSVWTLQASPIASPIDIEINPSHQVGSGAQGPLAPHSAVDWALQAGLFFSGRGPFAGKSLGWRPGSRAKNRCGKGSGWRGWRSNLSSRLCHRGPNPSEDKPGRQLVALLSPAAG